MERRTGTTQLLVPSRQSSRQSSQPGKCRVTSRVSRLTDQLLHARICVTTNPQVLSIMLVDLELWKQYLMQIAPR